MTYPRILIQFDTDPQCSTFDAVVAVDSRVDQLLQYSSVTVDNVVGLVHGAMFTRGPDQLKNTAIFVGGSNVAAGEDLVAKIRSTFFGPIRVSVMLDSNGANTTAVAAVLSAAKHIKLSDCNALVLGGTGPVGQRVARLVLGQGGRVTVSSRNAQRAADACKAISAKLNAGDRLSSIGSESTLSLQNELGRADVVFACGAAGVTLLDEASLARSTNLKIAIDLNAVPPAGIAGIGVLDKAVTRGARIDYGAIGVGGLKMKIHRAAIESLFQSNDKVLDAEDIFQVGLALQTK
jgi:methylenetetrahydrofolate/methylenetetrahydromethanopterin dehydrogenase (NADP+)